MLHKLHIPVTREGASHSIKLMFSFSTFVRIVIFWLDHLFECSTSHNIFAEKTRWCDTKEDVVENVPAVRSNDIFSITDVHGIASGTSSCAISQCAANTLRHTNACRHIFYSLFILGNMNSLNNNHTQNVSVMLSHRLTELLDNVKKLTIFTRNHDIHMWYVNENMLTDPY